MSAPSFLKRGALSAALASSVALAGCATMAPKTQTPASPVGEAYPAGPAYAAGAAQAAPQAAADIGWRDFFADPLLQDLVGRSLANNRDLRIATLNVERARAQYRIQRAQQLPTVALEASGAGQELPSELFYNRRSYQVGGAAAWEVDLWGRVRSLSNQALETYLGVEENRTAAQLSLIAEVANAYVTLRADQALLRLASDTRDAQQRAYDLTRQRVEVGDGDQLDLRRAEVALRTAQTDVAAYTRLAARDRNALALLVGEPLAGDLGKRLDTADTLSDGLLPVELPAGLPSDLLTRRPDIRAAEHGLRAANANIGAARAAFFPAISLTGFGGTASASLDDLFSSGSEAWSFAPRISLPIFQGGALRANLTQAKVQQRIEVATYEKSVQTAFREVSDGLAGKKTLDDQVLAEQQRVEASRAAHSLAETRYREGEDGNLPLLDAQRAYYGAEQSLVRARLARLTNLINLYKALGGGWSEGATKA